MDQPGKDEAKREQQVGYITTVFRSLHAGDDHVSEGAGEEVEDQNEEEEKASAFSGLAAPFGVSVESDRVIERHKGESCHEGVPWDLHCDVGQHECLPRVRFRWSFTGFVERALGDEVGHNHLDHVTKDGHQHEH